MKTLSTFVLTAVIYFAVTLFIAPADVSAQVTGSPCGCNDVADLIRLLGRQNAGIDKLEQLEKTVKRTDYFNEIMPEPNPTRMTKGESLLKTVNGVMNLAGPHPKFKANSPCVKDIDELKAFFHNSNFKNWAGKFVLLETYISLEKDVMARTVAEIVKRLNSMDRSCRPVDWFGAIMVTETKEQVFDERQPATDRFNLGGVMTQTDIYTRTGVIPVGRSDDVLSSWDFEGTLTRTEEHSSMHDCDTRAGEQFVNLVPFRTEKRGVTTRSGSLRVPMDVSPEVSEDGRKFQISFQIPEVRVLFGVSVSDTGVGGCPGEDYNRPESASGLTSSVGPEDVAVEGAILLGGPMDPEKVSGSQTKDRAPTGFSVPGTKLTHTVRVTYNLYKLKTSLIRPPRTLRRN